MSIMLTSGRSRSSILISLSIFTCSLAGTRPRLAVPSINTMNPKSSNNSGCKYRCLWSNDGQAVIDLMCTRVALEVGIRCDTNPPDPPRSASSFAQLPDWCSQSPPPPPQGVHTLNTNLPIIVWIHNNIWIVTYLFINLCSGQHYKLSHRPELITMFSNILENKIHVEVLSKLNKTFVL